VRDIEDPFRVTIKPLLLGVVVDRVAVYENNEYAKIAGPGDNKPM
jgi:hypothetical protein